MAQDTPVRPLSRDLILGSWMMTSWVTKDSQFVSRIRRWTGCNGRASIGNDDLKRSMPLSATATGAAKTLHSTTSEHGGVVSEPS